MFIAHLPSGYIFAKAILARYKFEKISIKTVIVTMILGAVFPDIDLVYFFLIDHQQVHHHRYFLHWPIFWIVLWLILFASLKLKQCKLFHTRQSFLALLFCSAAILHVILNTLAGDIWWFAPFIDQPYALFKIKAQYSPWWLNFIFHWSFWVEIFVCIIAGIIYLRSQKLKE